MKQRLVLLEASPCVVGYELGRGRQRPFFHRSKRGRVRSIIKTLVMSVLVLVGGVPLAKADAKPIVTLQESSYDFGTVAQGTKVVHEFEVKNSGTADLIIQRLSPSCGCTAATLSSPVVKPGASEKVRLSFDTSGFMGRKTKSVQILTNDTSSPEKLFTLTGTVASDVSVEPAKVDFGKVTPSASKTDRQRVITLSVSEGTEMKVTKVASLSNHVLISPVDVSGNKASVTVELLPSVPKGEFRDRVIFDVEGGRSVSVNVPIIASVKGDIQVSPTTVSFGVVSGEQIVERRVQFENKGEVPVSILSVLSSDPAVSATTVEIQPGKQGVVVVKVDPQQMRGDVRATVSLKTSHPTEPLVSVNVIAIQPPK